MRSIRNFAWFSLVVVAVLGLTPLVHAANINVDLNSVNTYQPLPAPNYAGVAAGPAAGTVWNHILPTATVNLATVDSYGVPSSVIFFQNFGANVATQNNGDQFGVDPAVRNPLASDIWINGSGTVPFGFSGLNPLNTYDLYVYNTGNGASVYLPAEFKLNGGATLAATGLDVGIAPENWVLGRNYVKFTGITGVSIASLTMTNGGLSPYDSAVSGLQLVTTHEVPEPSTVVLLAAGILGLLAYAWRKRK